MLEQGLDIAKTCIKLSRDVFNLKGYLADELYRQCPELYEDRVLYIISPILLPNLTFCFRRNQFYSWSILKPSHHDLLSKWDFGGLWEAIFLSHYNEAYVGESICFGITNVNLQRGYDGIYRVKLNLDKYKLNILKKGVELC